MSQDNDVKQSGYLIRVVENAVALLEKREWDSEARKLYGQLKALMVVEVAEKVARGKLAHGMHMTWLNGCCIGAQVELGNGWARVAVNLVCLDSEADSEMNGYFTTFNGVNRQATFLLQGSGAHWVVEQLTGDPAFISGADMPLAECPPLKSPYNSCKFMI